MDAVRGSDGLAVCRFTCTVGSVVGVCAGCGVLICVRLCMGLVGVVRLLRGMDDCWGVAWVVYGFGVGVGAYIKNFASATFVVEAIYVAATYSPTCAVPSA